MTPDMDFLAAFLKKTTGIILATDKGYLVESRLASVAACHGHRNVHSLVDALKSFPSEPLRRDVIEAMTTNETSFFRDGTPFEIMKNHVVPQLLAARQSSKRIRIWCAAASTGQEPYSLAMMLLELGSKLAGWKIEILGTDIDTTALKKASEATYSKFEIQRGLPVAYLIKYFEQAGPEIWRLKPAVRSMITFRQLNLLDGRAAAGTFDIVFCRNVLIYFDLPTKAAILGNLSSQLADDGYLFLGGAETVLGITDVLTPCPGVRGTYVKGQLRAAA
jgi:chemotaxis protein methyltransferase CheR